MSKVTTDINYDGSKITIRPSAIDTFYNCPFQWAKVFLEGLTTIPNARAAIGTAIHKGVEEMWKETQLTKTKETINLSMMCDAAIQEFQNLDQDLAYDPGENSRTAENEIVQGSKAFVEDIVPFVEIPTQVEHRIVIAMDHPIVSEVGGTIDYMAPGEISDVKTSKRKPLPQSYVTQQSTYKFLAESEGHKVDRTTIQGVALTRNPAGHVLELEHNVPRAKFLINTMLDTLDAFHAGVDPSLLFRGNPKYYLCSEKYCTLYNAGCPYVHGE